MENASKALIIAGAILLAILIISLGIMIYNQASGVVNNNAMNEVDISTFNNKFTQYEGTNVRGAQVKALIQQVVTNNVSNSEDSSRQVNVKIGDAEVTKNPPTSASSLTGQISTGKTYTVETTANTKTGLIETVTIKENTTSTNGNNGGNNGGRNP